MPRKNTKNRKNIYNRKYILQQNSDLLYGLIAYRLSHSTLHPLHWFDSCTSYKFCHFLHPHSLCRNFLNFYPFLMKIIAIKFEHVCQRIHTPHTTNRYSALCSLNPFRSQFNPYRSLKKTARGFFFYKTKIPPLLISNPIFWIFSL